MNQTPAAARSPTTTLARLFETNRDRNWYFVKPGGNWGDHLIYAGAEALARRIGLRWTDRNHENFDPASIPDEAAIYLHGGGGFNPWGSGRAVKNLQKALSTRSTLVIQGPQTAETQNPETTLLLSKAAGELTTGTEFHFLAREARSHAYLRATLPDSVSVHLDHDTAFHLTQADVLALAGLDRLPEGRYTLLVAREDDEAPAVSPSREQGIVVMDPAYFATSFKHWIRIHAFARRIISNRLHSSIVGALLEKPVVLMGGSYHKNRSIWEHSLRERGVEWRDDVGAGAKEKARAQRPTNLLLRSWKLRRAAMWLKGVPLE